MSNAPFIESTSADPFERAIARKVLCILNDPTLDRAQRLEQVRRAQGELLAHRHQQQRREALQRQLEHLALPVCYQKHSVDMRDGRLHVGVLKPGQGFVWLDTEEAAPRAAVPAPKERR